MTQVSANSCAADQLLEQARAALAEHPGRAEECLRELLRTSAAPPPQVHRMLGVALLAQCKPTEALVPLHRAAELLPDEPQVWRELNEALRRTDDHRGSAHAVLEELRASSAQPQLIRAGVALARNELPVAEHLLRDQLKRSPQDIAALRMLAEVAGRLGRFADARVLLEHALALAPSFAAARYNLAIVALRQQKPAEALAELEELLAQDPDNPAYLNLHGAALTGLGDLEPALADFAQVLQKRPAQPRVWMNYGHALKTSGRSGEAVEAYRRALSLDERLGEAWWSLANLKTATFSDQDLERMERCVARPDLRDGDALHLRFALGKAHEDRAAWERAFRNYEEGNRLRRSQIEHAADSVSTRVDRTIAECDAAFFAARAVHGFDAPDPIFVLGMPRSGSTLIEQILASHSHVEGTYELPDIQEIARRDLDAQSIGYTQALRQLTAARSAQLGEEYLRRTRIQRHSTRPFFIDKLPNNWMFVPLIHLLLPNAKIIDARRHPLACGFSNFKQHFARGQHFAYDLQELGRYYHDYARLMEHVDQVLPGRVHRVFYESMVTNTEAEVRALLQYLELEFEPECLQFFRTERSVRTASSEQVRQPIFLQGLSHWRNFEPWLQPLRAAVTAELQSYPHPT